MKQNITKSLCVLVLFFSFVGYHKVFSQVQDNGISDEPSESQTIKIQKSQPNKQKLNNQTNNINTKLPINSSTVDTDQSQESGNSQQKFIDQKLYLQFGIGLIKIFEKDKWDSSGVVQLAGLWKVWDDKNINLYTLVGIKYSAIEVEVNKGDVYYQGIFHQYLIPFQCYYLFKNFHLLGMIDIGVQQFKTNKSSEANAKFTQSNGFISSLGLGIGKSIFSKLDVGANLSYEFGKIKDVQFNIFTNFIF